MESYYTSHTEKKGDKSVKVYKKHVSKKSVEVTLEQWNALHKGDCEDYRDNRKEYEKLEYEPKKKLNTFSDEKFIKTVQKAATARKITVAEYRDKILFPNGKERIIVRFKQFLKLHSEVKEKQNNK